MTMSNSDSALFIPVIQFVLIFILMASSALWLKFRGVLTEAHAPVISKIITDAALPALIFLKISEASPTHHQIDAAMAMIGSELITGIIAWLIGRFVIRFNNYALGVFVIASTFGATGVTGTALIQVVFPNNAEALATGITLAQVGVGVPNNTIGVLIALWFGSRSSKVDLKNIVKTFILNPPVIAFIAGLLWSLLSLPHTGFLLTILFGALQFSGLSLTFLAALLTGLTMNKIERKDFGLPLFSCALLLLVAQPVIAYEIDAITGETESTTSVLLLLLGAMPASPLVIAYAVRYGGDVDLASKLVVCTYALSMFTLPILAYIYF
jgi:predicted permease